MCYLIPFSYQGAELEQTEWKEFFPFPTNNKRYALRAFLAFIIGHKGENSFLSVCSNFVPQCETGIKSCREYTKLDHYTKSISNLCLKWKKCFSYILKFFFYFNYNFFHWNFPSTSRE